MRSIIRMVVLAVLAVLPVRSFDAANGFFLPIIYAPLANPIRLTSVKTLNILRVLIE